MTTTLSRIGTLSALAAFTACGASVSPYQGMDAETLLQTAQAEYEEGQFENAIAALDRLIIKVDESGLVDVRRVGQR